MIRDPVQILHYTNNMSHEAYAQLRNGLTRHGSIGGSYAAAVIGLNDYKTPMRAWLELSGLLALDDGETEAMKRGRQLEAVILQMFQDEAVLPESAMVRPAQMILRHRVYPWCIATPDAYMQCTDGRFGIVEVKNTSWRMAPSWANGSIADAAHAQCLHTMAVAEADVGYVAALIGGNRFVWREVPRDEALIEEIMRLEVVFHDSILAQEPPPLTADDGEVLTLLYPPGSTTPGTVDLAVLAPEDAARWIALYEQGNATERQAKAMKDEARAHLQALLGQHERAVYGDTTVTWATRTRKSYVVHESTYRDFRVTTKHHHEEGKP